MPDPTPENISASREAGRRAARELLEQPDSGPGPAEAGEEVETRPAPSEPASLGEGVALVRRVLAEAANPPRWPMYLRQIKQFTEAAQPDFDERRYGSIVDLMRACQKEGILRLERDRQGGLRVFANGATARAAVPHGWGTIVSNTQDVAEAIEEPASLVAPLPPLIPEVVAVPGDAEAAAPAPKAKRAAKARRPRLRPRSLKRPPRRRRLRARRRPPD